MKLFFVRTLFPAIALAFSFLAVCRPGVSAGYTGELPDGADTTRIADNVFMRFQEIKIAGEGCSSNYRFLIHEDGRFFMQENKAADCRHRPAGSSFNRPFPIQPMKILDPAAINEIRRSLDVNGFFDMIPTSLPEEKVFDGSVKIMEVRSGKDVKRVITSQSSSKAMAAILEVIWSKIY